MSQRPQPAKRVLWAEDNDGDQFLIRAALGRRSGCGLEFTPDGAALLKALDGGPRPDLVVLDLNMPGMDGLEALRRLRSATRHQDLPVVVFSTGGQSHDVRACLALGAIDYVQKPILFPEFVAAVQRVVDYVNHPGRRLGSPLALAHLVKG